MNIVDKQYLEKVQKPLKDNYGRGKIKYLRWIDGRQGDGYKILYLWNWLFDLVLIRYPVGSYVRCHRDPVKRGNHHRINIELTRPMNGGHFNCDLKWVRIKLPRFVWFRPDKGLHSVSLVKGSERWVFSIGWIWGRKYNGKWKKIKDRYET